MISSVLSTGLEGLNNAAAQAERAARQIVDAGPRQDPADPRGEAVDAAREEKTVQGVVGLIRAETAFKASAAVVRTGDEMLGALLDIKV
jgi:hypothetical protein